MKLKTILIILLVVALVVAIVLAVTIVLAANGKQPDTQPTDTPSTAPTTAPTAGVNPPTTGSTAPTADSTAPTVPPTQPTAPTTPVIPPQTDSDALQIISVEMVEKYGDSTIIKLGDYEILVDAGDPDDRSNVQAMLEQYCTDDVLEMLIVTHAHEDHLGGFNTTSFFSAAGIEAVEVIVDFGYTYTTQAYKRYVSLRDALIGQGSTYYSIYDMVNSDSIPDIFNMDDTDAYIEFFDTGHYVKTGGKASGDLNDTSIAFCVNYKDTQLLMTGDLTTKCEQSLVNNLKSIDPDYFPESNRVIYKASHHASNGANSNTLLSFVKPDMVFISAAILKDNRTSAGIRSSQHPYSDAVRRMAAFTDEIYWNGINGTLIFTVTDSTCTVVGMGRCYDYYVSGQKVDAEAEKDITYLESAWYKR